MTIREELINKFDVEVEKFHLYYELKSLILGEPYTDSFERNFDSMIDEWFKGIIQSLYYKPNHYFLILKGKDERLSDFFRLLLPHDAYEENATYIQQESELYYELESKHIPEGVKYNYLLGCFRCPERVHLDLCEKDDFQIWTSEDAKMFSDGTPKPECDKRLLSYCGVTEKWYAPPRKSTIILEVDSVDWEKFNSIPKLQLWQEIFNKFKN